MTEGRVNKIVAAALFTVMLVVYLMTVAPTLSFWDCGEFISTSYTVGIPHPPGSPLLSLIGRVMTLSPIPDLRGLGSTEIAYRVNLLDVVLGALTVMFMYLIMVKLIRRFRPAVGSRIDTAVVLFCSAMTAFMVGFADEFWNNAIETETYMPSMLLSVIAVWLALRWEERKHEPRATLYLFLAAYLIGLGNGIHLTVLLIAPTVFLLVLFARPDWFASLKLWLSAGAFLAGVGVIKLFGGHEHFYLTVAVLALIGPAVMYVLYNRSKEVWHMTLIGLVLCGSLYAIGYSVYPTVMVRAAKSPSINEGDPQTWDRYKSYLDREQYGQGNMYAGMFERKADYGYQFGYMYLRYLMQQFPIWGPAVDISFTNDRSADAAGPVTLTTQVPVSVLLLSLLLYGFYTHAREDWKRFVALMAFFVASSAGLVLYLNMDNPQVRERGYFFLGSYMIIMVWIGMGILGLITDVREWLESKKLTRAVLPATLGFFAVFATLPPAAAVSRHLDPNYTNWDVHNRFDDWAPYDYAYNILVSCEKNAILFTNGDNDTFPLWYLQEVKGFRTDVRIINLSLLNTDWYILQLKNEGVKVPIEYDEEYIRNTLAARTEEAFLKRMWPAEGKEVEAAGMKWKLTTPQKINARDGEVGILRVQDVMVYNIINWTNWKRPLYFAVTVARENMCGLDDHLSMEGMVYRIVPTVALPGEMQVNVPVLDNNVFNRYQYRGLTDPDNYISPNTKHLVTNYFIGFAQLAERYATLGDSTNAVRAAQGAIDKTPSDPGKRALLYQVLANGKIYGIAKQYIEKEMAAPEWAGVNLSDRLAMYAILSKAGDREKALSMVRTEQKKSGTDSSGTDIWQQYIISLYTMGDIEGAMVALDEVLRITPNDRTMQETKAALLQQMQSRTPQDSSGDKSE